MSHAARSTQRAPICMRAWAIIGVLASGTLLAAPPAAANLEPVCSALGDILIEELAADDPTIWSDSGCSASGAEEFLVCDIEGTGGPCSSAPGCSAPGVEVDRSEDCTTSSLDAMCCTQALTKLCASCEPEVAHCIELCPFVDADYSTPTSPPSTPTTRSPPASSGGALTDDMCAEASDALLVEIAGMNSDYASTSCLSADAFVACDTLGSAGTCADNPSCTAVETTLADSCTSSADDSGCCTVFLAKPCDVCDPVPGACLQVCMGSESSTPTTVDPDPEPPTVLPPTPDDDVTIVAVAPSEGTTSAPDPPPPPPPPPPTDTPATRDLDAPSDYEEPELSPGDVVVGGGPSPLEQAVDGSTSASVPLGGLGAVCGGAAAAVAVLCGLL